jgi:hypothetical protein
MGNNGDFNESPEPVEIIREEVVEVGESPNDETFLLSSISIEEHTICHQSL